MLVTCILRCLGRLLWFVKSTVSGTTHRDMSTWKPISKSPRAVTNRTAHIQNCRDSKPIGVHLMMILYSLWHEFLLPPTSNSLHVQVATSAFSILHTTTSLWLTLRKQKFEGPAQLRGIAGLLQFALCNGHSRDVFQSIVQSHLQPPVSQNFVCLCWGLRSRNGPKHHGESGWRDLAGSLRVFPMSESLSTCRTSQTSSQPFPAKDPTLITLLKWEEHISFLGNNLSWLHFDSWIKVQGAHSWFEFSLNLKWMEEKEQALLGFNLELEAS